MLDLVLNNVIVRLSKLMSERVKEDDNI